MAKNLSVTAPFGDYERGAQITDAAEVASILESHPQNVVAFEAPDPAKAAAPEKEG